MARQQNIYTGATSSARRTARAAAGSGDITNHFAAANVVAESGLADVRDLFLNAGCGGASGYNCTAEAGTEPDAVYFRMYRAQIVLQDDADPVFTSPPSGLADSPVARSPAPRVCRSRQATSAAASSARDRGRRRARAVRAGVCAPPYTAVVPCKPAASGRCPSTPRRWPTARTASACCVPDATGTNAAVYGPFTITTSNAPTSCSPTEAPNLSVGFRSQAARRSPTAARSMSSARRRPARRCGSSARSRAPGAAAKLGRDAARPPTPPGKFTYKVPAGPSRALRFAYRCGNDPLFNCSKVARCRGQGAQLAQGLAADDPLRAARALHGHAQGRLRAQGRQADRAAGVRAQPLAQHHDAADELERRVLLPLPLLVPRPGRRRSPCGSASATTTRTRSRSGRLAAFAFACAEPRDHGRQAELEPEVVDVVVAGRAQGGREVRVRRARSRRRRGRSRP